MKMVQRVIRPGCDVPIDWTGLTCENGKSRFNDSVIFDMFYPSPYLQAPLDPCNVSVGTTLSLSDSLKVATFSLQKTIVYWIVDHFTCKRPPTVRWHSRATLLRPSWPCHTPLYQFLENKQIPMRVVKALSYYLIAYQSGWHSCRKSTCWGNQ